MPTAAVDLVSPDMVAAEMSGSPDQRPIDAARLSAFGPSVERGFNSNSHRNSNSDSGVSSPVAGFSSRDDMPAPSLANEVSSQQPAGRDADAAFGIIGGRHGGGGRGHGGPHRDARDLQNHFNTRFANGGYGRGGSPHSSPAFAVRNYAGLTSNRVAQQNAQDAAAAVLGSQTLIDAVRMQVEYYFSVENLTKDTYLLTKMNARMMVPLAEILSFPKIQKKHLPYEAVLDAVRQSKELVVEFIRDGQEVWDHGR